MTTPVLSEETLSKYTQFMRDPNLKLSTQEVMDLLESAKQYLGAVSRQEASGQSSRVEATNARVRFRNAAKGMLSRSPDLAADAKQALKRFIIEQPEFLAGEHKFSADFFSHNIEIWKRDLSRFAHQPDLNFLEIGSFEGVSACWLLKNILTNGSSSLTCIDTFDFGGQGSYYLQDEGSESMSIEERFDFNIRLTGSAAKVRKIVGFSQVVLRELTFSEYDYIYIDGSHRAVNVLEDTVLCWPLLKKGGLLTFDDYEWDGDPDPRNCPKPAIDAFMDIFEGHYKLIHQAYQVTVEKL